jgi:hypothetical protein
MVFFELCGVFRSLRLVLVAGFGVLILTLLTFSSRVDDLVACLFVFLTTFGGLGAVLRMGITNSFLRWLVVIFRDGFEVLPIGVTTFLRSMLAAAGLDAEDLLEPGVITVLRRLLVLGAIGLRLVPVRLATSTVRLTGAGRDRAGVAAGREGAGLLLGGLLVRTLGAGRLLGAGLLLGGLLERTLGAGLLGAGLLVRTLGAGLLLGGLLERTLGAGLLGAGLLARALGAGLLGRLLWAERALGACRGACLAGAAFTLSDRSPPRFAWRPLSAKTGAKPNATIKITNNEMFFFLINILLFLSPAASSQTEDIDEPHTV